MHWSERDISISDEMPGPWRRGTALPSTDTIAIFQSQTRCQAPGDATITACRTSPCMISISDEMPGPWRQECVSCQDYVSCLFQSQTRCQAPGDTDMPRLPCKEDP